MTKQRTITVDVPMFDGFEFIGLTTDVLDGGYFKNRFDWDPPIPIAPLTKLSFPVLVYRKLEPLKVAELTWYRADDVRLLGLILPQTVMIKHDCGSIGSMTLTHAKLQDCIQCVAEERPTWFALLKF